MRTLSKISLRLKALGFTAEEGLAALACLLLIYVGSFFNPAFATPRYLLLQAQTASFMGIIAIGAMMVILLGQIDLSVPWNMAGTAILTTTLAGSADPSVAAVAIPAAWLAGALIGLFNGLGVAILRIPSLVWTLSMNSILLGLSTFLTSGHKPRGVCPKILTDIAHGHVLGIPSVFILWSLLGVIAALTLRRTVFGKYLYAIGNSEKAVYMSGVPTAKVVIFTFVLAGFLTTLGGQLLAGYVNQAYQSMGDTYVMPILASIVIGGTSILGGRGTYLGTVLGVLFVTLLTSILSVMQMPESVRQIIFGSIILAVLLLHNFRRRSGRRPSQSQAPEKAAPAQEARAA
ncbi:MAG: ABC transporter permease [Deltaproteobacteria bacterium]|nr:ABC transporter permease [Deltaproteobacteria bacterium]